MPGNFFKNFKAAFSKTEVSKKPHFLLTNGARVSPCLFAVLYSLLILLSFQFLFTGCRNDLLGLFRATELDVRLEERNNFVFLQPKDRNLSLGSEYSFIVLSDTHMENDKTHGLEKLKDLIAADSDIKFVVVTGDITQNGDREVLQKFVDIAGDLGVPCYPVLGNHDIYFNNWPHWADLIGSSCYRIDHDEATLFILDSANSYFGKYQLDWLESEIKNTHGRVFVFTHVNLFTTSPTDIQQLVDVRERARICSILSGHADYMFTGHLHTGYSREAGGVAYLSVEGFVDYQSYCRVTVKSTGISYRYDKL